MSSTITFCMNVLVVGGGTAGLTAAIGLRNAGHRVRLFERYASVAETGASIVIGPNATKILEHFGFDFEAAQANQSLSIRVVKGDSMDKLFAFDDEALADVYGAKEYFSRRVDLQEGLMQLAVRKKGQGFPVEIIYNSKVESYDTETGTVKLFNGEKYSADLVVAADGVRSRAPKSVLGYDRPTSRTVNTVVRFMLTSDEILADPLTSLLLEKIGQFTIYVGPSERNWMIQAPCSNNKMQEFGLFTLVDSEVETAAQESRFQCDRDSLRRELEGFHESILGVVSKAKEILPIWKLPEGQPTHSWYKGRVVMIGDAAHNMLPHQGQGGGQSIEDGASLGILMQDMTDASIGSITKRLDAFEKLRKGRATVTQLLSGLPFQSDSMELMRDECLKHLPREQLPENTEAIRGWLCSYNVLEHSQEALGHVMKNQTPA